MTKQWWCISVNGRYLGKAFETRAGILSATGPYVTIEGNHINVFAPKR